MPVVGFTTNSWQLLLISLSLLAFSPYNYAKENSKTPGIEQIQNMDQASLFLGHVENPYKTVKPDLPLIPASTLKLLTGLFALQTWGSDHKFITDFYLGENNILWIKGYGDPFLISEEINLIVAALKKKGLKKIAGIGIDDSYFSEEIIVDGQSQTDNPYDASLSTLAANFNTFNIIRDKNGLQSAESQTPLTPLMKSLAKELPNGEHRINLGMQEYSSVNFAQILSIKLKASDVEVGEVLINGIITNTQTPFYRHKNSHDLSAIISAMLKYSNNFIANQLFLLLGVKAKGAPASMAKSRSTFDQKMAKIFDWKHQIILEGSGLSRSNRLSARQLIDVLEKFASYKQLLSQQNDHILAKSGTLTGISTYAGYLRKNNKWQPFVIMINQAAKYNLRKQVAEELLYFD
ncbi:MAG: D-alanyl-D-alanine carboxypeptidase [Gammaproteobacteria bacterium]